MQKDKKNRRIVLIMAVVLAIATAVAGTTFAWFTDTDSVTNHLETGQWANGDVKIVEVFDPDLPWEPGVDMNKDVWCVNTGNIDALVRISFAEVLSMLDKDGEAFPVDKNWDDTNDSMAIPVLFNAKALAAGGAYYGWKSVTDSTTPFDVNSLPAGVTVLWDKFPNLSPTTSPDTYQFVAYATLKDGRLQRVSADSAFNKAGNELTVSKIKYWEAYRKATIYKKWAALSAQHDTALQAEFLGAFPPGFQLATPTGAAITLPSIKAVSDPGGFISLFFTNYVSTDLAAITAIPEGNANYGKMWWYNAADGYMYFIGKAAPGKATSELLDFVRLSKDANNAYTSMSFDLIVKMDSIQAVPEAVTDGWGVSNAALVAALQAQGAFVLTIR